MTRQPVITKDGSHTIAIPEMNVMYHSVYGAIAESIHVYINAGVSDVLRASDTLSRPDIFIFEMGFGTGLNALLSLMESQKTGRFIHYTALELFPLDQDAINKLNYCDQLNRKDLLPIFNQFHQCDWEKDITITPTFTLHKINADLLNFSTDRHFNLIYYDAFAPAAQPDLWTKEIFEKLYSMMTRGGILVTYCSKGEVRRAMKSAGFTTEKLTGPPGKREMLRAKKSPESGVGSQE